MKYALLCIVLAVTCGYGMSKSTIFDTLKDGYDAVFSYEFENEHNLLKGRQFEEFKYDIHFRKASTENKFIMFFSKITHESNVPGKQPTPADLKAMELPVIVTVDADLNLEYVMASADDTHKSLDEKSDLFKLFLIDISEAVEGFPEMLEDVNYVSFKNEHSGMPFGTCDVNTKISKKNSTYRFKTISKKDECKGQVIQDLATKIGISDVTGDSEFITAYYFDKETLHLHGVQVKMFMKDAEHEKHTFKVETESYFKAYEPVDKEIDEAKFTVKYTPEELSELN